VGRPIEARRVVPAPAAEVFAFLSDLDNHWVLTGSRVERLESGADSSVVRMRGPFGIERTARTLVVEADPPRRMSGWAEVGTKTAASVRWSLDPVEGRTHVHLSATVEAASPGDRLIMALGGRAWFRRCFDHALSELAGRFSRAR
jgi:hypothetical protein